MSLLHKPKKIISKTVNTTYDVSQWTSFVNNWGTPITRGIFQKDAYIKLGSTTPLQSVNSLHNFMNSLMN